MEAQNRSLRTKTQDMSPGSLRALAAPSAPARLVWSRGQTRVSRRKHSLRRIYRSWKKWSVRLRKNGRRNVTRRWTRSRPRGRVRWLSLMSRRGRLRRSRCQRRASRSWRTSRRYASTSQMSSRGKRLRSLKNERRDCSRSRRLPPSDSQTWSQSQSWSRGQRWNQSRSHSRSHSQSWSRNRSQSRSRRTALLPMWPDGLSR